MLNRGPAERSMTASISLAMTNWERKHAYVCHDTLQRASWPICMCLCLFWTHGAPGKWCDGTHVARMHACARARTLSLSFYTYIHMYEYTHKYICIHTYIYIHIYIYICIYLLNSGSPWSPWERHVCRHIHIQIYTYTAVLVEQWASRKWHDSTHVAFTLTRARALSLSLSFSLSLSLSLCLSLSLSMYTYTYAYSYIYIYIYTYLHIHIYILVEQGASRKWHDGTHVAFTLSRARARALSLSLSIHIHIHIHVYTYICTYSHTYIYILVEQGASRKWHDGTHVACSQLVQGKKCNGRRDCAPTMRPHSWYTHCAHMKRDAYM